LETFFCEIEVAGIFLNLDEFRKFFTKRERSIKMEGHFHFFYSTNFLTKCCFYKKRKINNKNGRLFPFLFYEKFSNFLTKYCFYKKRKIKNKNGRLFPFLFYFYFMKKFRNVVFTKREKSIIKIEGYFHFYFTKKISNFLTKCCFYEKRKIKIKNGS
jgi:hypothetical protein